MIRSQNGTNISRNSSSTSSGSVGSLDLSSVQDSNQSWYPQDANMSRRASARCEDTRTLDMNRYRNEDTPQSTTTNADQPNGSNDDATGSKTATSDNGCSDMDSCTIDMATQRECLRKRFKEWSGKMDQTVKRLRDVTDNALVNQNMRLEHTLHEGKARIDVIEEEQSNIRARLSNFVSMLSDAQVHIFTKHRNPESRSSRAQKAPPAAQ